MEEKIESVVAPPEKPILLTADRARYLCNQSRISMESLLQEVERQAKNGWQYTIHTNLDDNHIIELISLGYTVSKFTGVNGDELVKIKF